LWWVFITEKDGTVVILIMKSKKTQEEPTFKDKKFLKVGFLFFSLVIFLDVILWYLGKKNISPFLIYSFPM